jgi:hypothetical protein
MTPVEADGLAAAMERLVGGRFGMKAARGRKYFSPLLELVDESGAMAETADEGHRRGIAFLMVVSRPFAAAVAGRLRRLGSPAWPLALLGPVVSPKTYRPPATTTSFLSRAKGFNNDGRSGQSPETSSNDNQHRGKTIPPGHGD